MAVLGDRVRTLAGEVPLALGTRFEMRLRVRLLVALVATAACYPTVAPHPRTSPGVRTATASPDTASKGPIVDTSTYGPYAGWYAIAPGRTLLLTTASEGMLARWPNGEERQVFLLTPTEFAAGPDRLRFTLGPDGRPREVALLVDGREVWRAARGGPVARRIVLPARSAAPVIDSATSGHLSPTLGFRAGSPFVSSVVLGVVYESRPRSRHVVSGPFIQGEAGAVGGALGVGYMYGGDGGATWWRVAVMRPWLEKWRGDPQRTYVGIEGRMMVGLVGLGFGAYVRAAGEQGYDMLPAASLGVGY